MLNPATLSRLCEVDSEHFRKREGSFRWNSLPLDRTDDWCVAGWMLDQMPGADLHTVYDYNHGGPAVYCVYWGKEQPLGEGPTRIEAIVAAYVVFREGRQGP